MFLGIASALSERIDNIAIKKCRFAGLQHRPCSPAWAALRPVPTKRYSFDRYGTACNYLRAHYQKLWMVPKITDLSCPIFLPSTLIQYENVVSLSK